MKFLIKSVLLIVFITALIFPSQKQTISFKAKDGVTITADLYLANPNNNSPFILLFHQAGWSRGEYLEIAPKLNKMGFNCMAVDLRSGDAINSIKNLTHEDAVRLGKKTDYINSLQDLDAAVKYARSKYANGKLIIWGSSYSAGLVFKYASENNKSIDGILAFSPGEYFEKAGKSKTYITEAAGKVKCPVFITSGKYERPNWQSIYDAIPSKVKSWFLPSTEGHHGSRALFEKYNDNGPYWLAVKNFLRKYFLSEETGH